MVWAVLKFMLASLVARQESTSRTQFIREDDPDIPTQAGFLASCLAMVSVNICQEH